MMKRRMPLFGLLGILFVLGFVTPLSAELFENYTTGGRALGMGGAFVAVADDVYALAYNPAGLSHFNDLVLNLNYQPTFAFDDVNSIGTLAGYGFGDLTVGLSFFQVSQDAGLSMGKVDFGAGMKLAGLKFGPVSNIRVGLVFHMFMLGLDGYDADPNEGLKDSASAIGVGLGAQCNLFDKDLAVGFFLDNINAPSISLFENGTGSEVKRTLRLGLSYIVNEYFMLAVDYAFRDYPDMGSLDNLFLGAEINFFNAVMLRFGFDEGKMSTGLGVKSANFDFNMALRVENEVDIYYQFDLSLKLGLAGGDATE